MDRVVVDLDTSASPAARWLEDSAWVVGHLLRAAGDGDGAIFDPLLALLGQLSERVGADAVSAECRRLAGLRTLLDVVPSTVSLGPLQDAWYADCTVVALAPQGCRPVPAGSETAEQPPPLLPEPPQPRPRPPAP